MKIPTLNPSPSPLNLFAANLVGSLGQQYIQQQQNARENQKISQAFSDIDENTSPLTMITKLASLDVNPEKKKYLMEGLKHIGEQKELVTKQALEQQKISLQKQQAFETADYLGIPREQVPEGATSKDVVDLYKATKPKQELVSQLPETPEQKVAREKVETLPNFKEMTGEELRTAYLNAGASPIEAERAAKIRQGEETQKEKKIETAYKHQEKFIQDTTQAYRGFETEFKPRLMQMQKLATDEQLISPTQEAFLDALGIPLGAIGHPYSELYKKLSLDLLKGLPETYGNRILKVEVDNFLNTIPQLSNSPDGRRMIASNMLKLGEMKEAFYNEMRRQQLDYEDKNKELPRDFEQKVFDQVKPQIDRINQEFVKMSSITSIPKDTIPFFNPSGDIEFVPKEHAQWAQENGGRRIW